jgi:hypothetical protein
MLCGIGLLGFRRIPWHIQRASMESIVERAEPLIEAIELYTLDNSKPPPSLESLVPKYLHSVPKSGLRDLHDFEYHVGPNTKKLYCGNPWVLTVFTPRGGLNFDMLIFFPDQNYPNEGYGGVLERIANWAYVHE